MCAQVCNVVQTHIAGQLEFQHHIVCPDFFHQLSAPVAFQAGAVQPVTDTHIREPLSRQQGIFHKGDGFFHIGFQRVVFPGVYADCPVSVIAGNLGHNFFYNCFQFADIVYFFPYKVTAHHIWVFAHHLQRLYGICKVTGRCDVLFYQGQRNTAYGSQKTDIHPCFSLYQRQDAVYLLQHFHIGSIFFNQCGVADFHIFYIFFLIFTAYPQQGIFVQGVAGIVRVGIVCQHSFQIGTHIPVFDSVHIHKVNAIVTGHTFCENISVQIQLFQVGKHSL